MNPILFESTAQTFNTHGIGTIEPVDGVVIGERNGQFEVQVDVMVGSRHFDDIRECRILYTETPTGNQPFRIYALDEPLNGRVTVRARHLSYDLSYNSVMPFTASGVGTALTGLKNNAVEDCPFTFWTDKTTTGTFTVDVPCSIRSRLGGAQGSILDRYGGEYEWDHWTVKLWNRRGTDRGVTLRYGKNITDLQQEKNLENVVTGIVPFWKGEDTIVTLPEKAVYSEYVNNYPYRRTVPVDFSGEWENAPTQAQLRAKAEAYIIANDIGKPKVSIKVSFVPLWQTEEYKDIAPLERVYLCDTVGVHYDRYNIDARAKVVKYEWDILKRRYRSIELGEARSNMASTVVNLTSEIQDNIQSTKSELEKAIDFATDMITGANGGNIVLRCNADGEPYELLIMDTKDITTARDVWRFNQAGLGHSSTGYNGPYTLGMLQDGSINATMITVGILSTALLQTGVIRSANDNMTIDLDTGDITAKSLAVDAPYFKMTKYGSVVASDLTLVNNSGGENIIDTTDFTVNDRGQIVATGADISGTVRTGSSGRNIEITGYSITGRENSTAYGVITFDRGTLTLENSYINLKGNLQVDGYGAWETGSVVTSITKSESGGQFVTGVGYQTDTFITEVNASSDQKTFVTGFSGNPDTEEFLTYVEVDYTPKEVTEEITDIWLDINDTFHWSWNTANVVESCVKLGSFSKPAIIHSNRRSSLSRWKRLMRVSSKSVIPCECATSKSWERMASNRS